MTTLIPKFEQAFTNAVNRPINQKLAETLSILDFGADATGATDSTTAIQNAITAGVTNSQIVFFPAGTYLVTDTLNIPIGTQICGEHQHNGVNTFGIPVNSTTINFVPASAKSLFVASGATYGGENKRFYYSISGLYIKGNSTTPTGNSVYAFDLTGIGQSSFSNLAIENFQTGIYAVNTLTNDLTAINIENCTVSCVTYGGTISPTLQLATTDVWSNCIFRTSPIGVQSTGASLTIRFEDCFFESCTNYGVNLDKESWSWEFHNCSSENIPATVNGVGLPNPDGAMFKVGYSGTTKTLSNSLTIIGGYYAGNDYTPGYGYFLDCDDTNGVAVVGVYTTRYENSIRATANTLNGSITVCGLNCISQAGVYTGPDGKITGVIANGVQNTGNIKQDAYLGNAAVDYLDKLNGTGTLIIGSNIIAISVGKANSYVVPGVDNSLNFGLSSLRWKEIYAANGTINTSDEREKQDIKDLSTLEKEVAVAIKGLIKSFRFKTSVAEKGDKARIHFGVMAQQVAEAFKIVGLNPDNYALFCYDEWEADADMGIEAGNRYGIRYDELLAFVISAI